MRIRKVFGVSVVAVVFCVKLMQQRLERISFRYRNTYLFDVKTFQKRLFVHVVRTYDIHKLVVEGHEITLMILLVGHSRGQMKVSFVNKYDVARFKIIRAISELYFVIIVHMRVFQSHTECYIRFSRCLCNRILNPFSYLLGAVNRKKSSPAAFHNQYVKIIFIIKDCR